MRMRLTERIAVGIATAAAATQFVVARYLPDCRGQLDPDFPRMSPAQSAWMIGAPALIVAALALARRQTSDRVRLRLTVGVAIGAVAAVVGYLAYAS